MNSFIHNSQYDKVKQILEKRLRRLINKLINNSYIQPYIIYINYILFAMIVTTVNKSSKNVKIKEFYKENNRKAKKKNNKKQMETSDEKIVEVFLEEKHNK